MIKRWQRLRRTTKIRWNAKTDQRRYYFFLALLTILLIITLPFLLAESLPDPPNTAVGLIGASTIFILHEVIQSEIEKLSTRIELLGSNSISIISLTIILDLLISTPMISFGVHSQTYTALLVGTIMFGIYMYIMYNIYRYVSKSFRLDEEEKEEVQQRVQEKNEKQKRKMQKRLKSRMKKRGAGKSQQRSAQRALNPANRLLDKLTRLEAKAQVQLLNQPSHMIYLAGVGFLLYILLITFDRIRMLLLSGEIPVEMKILIVVTTTSIGTILFVNRYMRYKEPDKDSISKEELITIFKNQRVPILTASDVTKELHCSRLLAYKSLEELVAEEASCLYKKEIGTGSIVYIYLEG